MAPLLAYPLVVVALAATVPRWLWREPARSGALRILGAGLLGAAMIVPLVFYDLVVTVSAGLCGRTGWPEVLAAAVAFAVVVSWGVRSRRRIVVALPAAVLAANACALLTAYADSGAHGHCETLMPYVVSV